MSLRVWMVVSVLLLGSAAGVAPADETPAADVAGFKKVVGPLLAKYCADCHGASEPEAGLSLHKINGDLIAGPDTAKWQKIADRLAFGEMPPPGEPRPDAGELARVNNWLRAELRKAGKTSAAEKLLHPGYGNYVPHEALFSRDAPAVAASEPRLWRMNPHVYTIVAEALTKRSDFAQPFAFEGGEGIRDFAALYSVDEPTTDLVLRNALEIARSQMRYTVDKDGKLTPMFRSLGEAVAIIDPKSERPTREEFEKLIRRQFDLVLQRSPSDDELARLTDFAERTMADAGAQHAVQTTLATVLLTPEAVFRLELGEGTPDEHGRVMLAPREIAYALSYALTDRRPDGNLLRAAADGKLATRDDVRRDVERMLADEKLEKPRIMRFFREYFGYGAAIDVFKDQKEFEEHDARILVGDTDQLVEQILAEDRNVLEELLTTNKSFVNWSVDRKAGPRPANEKRRVQYSYSLPEGWRWTKEQPIALPRGERAGILTQPSWLVAHSLNTENHAIRRGKWVRERLLGGTVPELPITVDAQLPEDPTRTLRERMSVTEEKYCWQCHQKMNPLGLPFETYDHFGRFRTEELGRPVDATGAVAIGVKEVDGDVTSAVEMIHRLAKSDRVRQVFVRHAFRYWMGRNETPSDAPTLIAADEAYQQSGGSMRALITSLLTSDSFLYRMANTVVTLKQ
jgi:hypothetical protein